MDCPKCLGAKEIMQSKGNDKKGFKYEKCDICEGRGVVLEVQHQSFVDSLVIFEEDLLDTTHDEY